MTHLNDMTADDLLSIPVDMPEKLFSSPENAKAESRVLFMAWHPDSCAAPRAQEVFQHVKSLFQAAERRIAQGDWETPGVLKLMARDGALFEVKYACKLGVDIGTMYVGRKFVGFDCKLTTPHAPIS